MAATTATHSVSVAAVIINDDGRLLAIQRRDNHHWEPPGGVLEPGETLYDGLRREVREETGITIDIEAPTGIYQNLPRGIVSHVFRCRAISGQATTGNETARIEWFRPDEIPALMDEAFAVRMLDALDHGPPHVRTHDGVRLLSENHVTGDRWSWTTAERPGSDTQPSQDRVGHLTSGHHTWAYAIDGATTYTDLHPDGGEYAEALETGIRDAVQEQTDLKLVLKHAIAAARDALTLPRPARPSAAVGLALLTPTTTQLALLGDVVAVVQTVGGSVERVTDARITEGGGEFRDAAEQRLRDGRGYDETHRDLIRSLQELQRGRRNVEGGYWIAADDPEAADHALTWKFPTPTVCGLLIATDGVAAGTDQYSWPHAWSAFFDEVESLRKLVDSIHDVEAADPRGQQWPRFKIHDDKAIIVGRQHRTPPRS